MASRCFGRLLCVSAIACAMLSLAEVVALAWTHDTGEAQVAIGGSWYACGASYATSANIDDGRYARWYPAWDFRGRFRMDIQVPCATNDRGKDVKHHVRRTDGTEYQAVTFTQCGRSGWYNLFGDTNWNGDGDRYSRVYFYAYTDTAYPNCYTGYNAVTAGKGHTYGEKWDYINDWVCLGGYGGVIGDNATGWTESDIYLYPAVDTTHGNVFNYGGKTPGRVQTGDCNWENKLNWKGNAASYGNCDNCYSYGFAWMYSPGGAGPKFLIGADDDQKTWVNGTLISSGSSCCNRDNFETGGISMPAGWSRILFKVRNGGGGFDGTVSLRAGNDRGWNEGSVTRYSSSYGLGYEQDAWYPGIDVSSFEGLSDPKPNNDVYTNDTTINASGTAWGNGPVPFWKVMHWEWGYGIAETNYLDVSSIGTSWSHSQTGVTGHRRFHFFAVSKSKRTSRQNSGSSGGDMWADGGYGNYIDVYVDNVAPVNPSFSSAVAASTSQINLGWAIPLDKGVGTADGATEAWEEGGGNTYRRGEVGVAVYRNGSAVYGWGTGTSTSDTGLAANTAYTYTIAARDNTSQSRGAWANTTGQQGSTVVWTLSVAPTAGSVSKDVSAPCPGDNITWTAVGGFGAGKVQKYKYAWSQSPTHSWTGSETDWASGTVVTSPTSAGTWYLHVKGYNGADVANGTYAYQVETGPAPVSPTANIPVPAVSSITWKWNDVTGENGYRVKDTGGINKSGDLGADATEWTETDGIADNTQYTRRIHSFNACGESTGYADETKYSLAAIPAPGPGGNVATTASGGVWYNASTWPGLTNPQTFGTGGKVSKFKYKWSANPTDSIAEGEGDDWTSGTLTEAPESDGEWYVYMRSYNGDGVGNGSVRFGPYKYDKTAPVAAGPYSTSTSSSGITVNYGAGSDATSGLNGSGPYRVTRGDQFDSGWTSSHSNTDPASGLSAGDIAEYTVKTRDEAGNEASHVIKGRKLIDAANEWIYTTGAAALAPPGVLPNSAVYTGSGDTRIHGFAAADAAMLWAPVTTGDAIQGRTPIAYFGSTWYVLAGSHDTYVYKVNASTGAAAWSVSLGVGNMVNGKVAGQLNVSTPGGTKDLIFAGTYNLDPQTGNFLRALDASDGSEVWTFGSGYQIDKIPGSPAVYAVTNTVYFTSMSANGTQPSVWAVDSRDGTYKWSASIGDVPGSCALNNTGTVLYVGSKSGVLYAFDAATGSQKWSRTLDAGYAIYGAPWYYGGKLYVASNAGKLWCVIDNGTSSSLNASWGGGSGYTSVAMPSQPVLYEKTGKVYVGSSDGKLYQLNMSDGAKSPANGYALGFTVGDPAVDAMRDSIYVGASDGRVYSIHIPF